MQDSEGGEDDLANILILYMLFMLATARSETAPPYLHISSCAGHIERTLSSLGATQLFDNEKLRFRSESLLSQ